MSHPVPKYAFFNIQKQEADGSWTDVGKINFKLFSNTPITSTNFGRLCNGVTFPVDKQPLAKSIGDARPVAYHGYKSLTFHRVIKNFMIQGGCWFTRTEDPLPVDGTPGTGGTGADGVKFADENFNNSNKIGTLSCANAGPNTNGSQFFINTKNNLRLDEKHCVFGTVNDYASFDVVRKIEADGAQIKFRIADCGVTEYYTEEELQKVVGWQPQNPDGDIEFF
eukprot:UN02568